MVVPMRLANRMRRVWRASGRGVESSNAGNSSERNGSPILLQHARLPARSMHPQLSRGHRLLDLRQQVIHVALPVGLIHDHGTLFVGVEMQNFGAVMFQARERRR